MKKFQLGSVSSPNVELEVGGIIQQTQTIKNTSKNPNFSDPILFLEIVSLPPPLQSQLPLPLPTSPPPPPPPAAALPPLQPLPLPLIPPREPPPKLSYLNFTDFEICY